MTLAFLSAAAPLPHKLVHPAGVLFYLGSTQWAWERVADSLAQGKFPSEVRGNFAFVWQGQEETIAAVDHVATYPLFYSHSALSHIFHALKEHTPNPTPNPKVSWQIEFLGGQSLSTETTVKEISRLLPGHYLRGSKQTSYIDFFAYENEGLAHRERFRSMVEQCVARAAKERNVLLLSGGTDSTTLAGIVKKLGLDSTFEFVHIYSDSQTLTEKKVVERISQEMGLSVRHCQVRFAGDILPEQKQRQFSFWIENPFPAKRQGVEASGLAHARIFTGEVSDQLFGGPKNSALLNFALQAPRFSADEIAALWIQQSATYGKSSSSVVSGRVFLEVIDDSFAAEAYAELVADIASLFRRMRSRDFLNRVMLLNYLVKGPYRTWAYSQDELDWAHPFASWELFDYAFQLRSSEKIGPGGRQKAILLDSWRSHLSELPWRLPKHGFGIPSVAKLRLSPQHVEH